MAPSPGGVEIAAMVSETVMASSNCRTTASVAKFAPFARLRSGVQRLLLLILALAPTLAHAQSQARLNERHEHEQEQE